MKKNRKLKLGVNIDHIATLRQLRNTKYPDLAEAAMKCESAGADGITVHLREDRRHIQDKDIFILRKIITTKLNMEMANSPEIVKIALKAKPDEVCIVPERREELTTEGGLKVSGVKKSLKDTVARLTDAGIMVSLFIDPDKKEIEAALDVGAKCIELHTGKYCLLADKNRIKGKIKELEKLKQAAIIAHNYGLKVNAGHGLNIWNIKMLLDTVPYLDTLNIGHSIICRSVFIGIENAVREMIEIISSYKL